MAIRITRNEAGNCITFVGSSNPVYWNACLSAQLNESNSALVDIINDIRSANEETIQYEFYAVDATDFADKDGNAFSSPEEMVDYVNLNANVTGVSDTGTDLTDVSVNFRLDETSTSVIMDNGASFGVNTIKAVADTDGTIHIHAIGAGSPDGSEDAGDHKHFEKLVHTNVSVNGNAVAGGLQDVVNTLNELFTVGAFEAVVISDPYSTMIADVSGVDAAGALVGDAVNPSNSDVAAGSADHYNKAGWLSSDTIDQAGEYFSFDIRVEGIIGMCLVVDDVADVNGSATYGDPTKFCDGVSNSGHYGIQFGHFFHPSPNGPWTNYGANTGYVQGVGWSNATHKFSGSPEGADWIAGNPVKMRTGLDETGFISIDYYDASEGAWITCARTTYPTLSGVKYKLGIKLCDSNARLASLPKIHLLEDLAPTMNFRFIESPDGNYDHPVFATEEEANYYDLQNGGTGTSTTDTYADDPTGTTWYIPTNGFNDDQSVAPTGGTFMGNNINWTEVTSLTNADLTPSAFSSLDYSYEEGTAVNFQLLPAGATFTQTVSISPAGSGMVYNSGTGYLQGTLTDVGADTTYTVTVTRANAYGSSVGTFEVVATDVAPVQTMITPWTKALNFSGSSEHLKQVTQSSGSNAIRMSGLSSTVVVNSDLSKTSNDTLARPWATAVMFQTPNNTSNQHIWNSGEGSGTNADNIYLRITGTNGDLYFGWGREGVGYNECLIGNVGASYNQSTGQWWGIYIGHKGQRFNAALSTAQNLANAFDIKLMGTNDGPPMGNIYTVGETASDWTSTGYRMDRSVTGDFTIGGRGSNRNFHGKVASMVVTTLRRDYAMPSDAEAELMITDPKKWEDDYRVGQTVRSNNSGSNTTYDVTNGKYGTQIWLMGDGTSDSYSNGIRNQVDPTDQNYTKLQLNSMVSNDIETVSIAGLT
jgi:hypothetical protein